MLRDGFISQNYSIQKMGEKKRVISLRSSCHEVEEDKIVDFDTKNLAGDS